MSEAKIARLAFRVWAVCWVLLPPMFVVPALLWLIHGIGFLDALAVSVGTVCLTMGWNCLSGGEDASAAAMRRYDERRAREARDGR